MAQGIAVSVLRAEGQAGQEAPHAQIVAAVSAHEGLELVADDRPEGTAVVIVSAKRASPDMLEGIREHRSRVPKPAVIVVLERLGNGDVVKAINAGADGIVPADCIAEALVPTVRAAAAGQLVIPREARQEVRRQALTMREKQILSLVVMGLTNGQIASKLFLAESTVKSHLSSAFTKLSVSSRNEAVTLILDPERGRGLGILTIPSEPLASHA